jgi:hypothetical protein
LFFGNSKELFTRDAVGMDFFAERHGAPFSHI